ncbi:MAG: diversity-generating retroelement protein Avd [Phycisphaerae bacterium]|nr:diversity-generating retroelement protein Avd [Phycisphaerae bacterium]
MSQKHELKIISDFYDFMLWMTRHTEKFPRHHRYSLGLAIEQRLQRILELLLRAKYSRDKVTLLGDTNIELEILRFQIRMAKDLEVLAIKSHGYAANIMLEIGSQLGGWLKQKSVKNVHRE